MESSSKKKTLKTSVLAAALIGLVLPMGCVHHHYQPPPVSSTATQTE